jgi:hypothetical protein
MSVGAFPEHIIVDLQKVIVRHFRTEEQVRVYVNIIAQ